MAGFDHGFRKVLVFNFAMLAACIFLWSHLIRVWAVILAAIVLAVLSLDKYVGMFISMLVLALLTGAGISLFLKSPH